MAKQAKNQQTETIVSIDTNDTVTATATDTTATDAPDNDNDNANDTADAPDAVNPDALDADTVKVPGLGIISLRESFASRGRLPAVEHVKQHIAHVKNEAKKYAAFAERLTARLAALEAEIQRRADVREAMAQAPEERLAKALHSMDAGARASAAHVLLARMFGEETAARMIAERADRI